MKVVEGIEEMRGFSGEARRGGKVIVFVPTMGFLHDGHAELLRRGRALGDVLVLSIFVNPAQFSPGEDFESYPRDIERDLSVARENGVDVVFTPSSSGMYPAGFQTFVEVGELEKYLCGAVRPGHFRGVATVVVKLFNIVRPHRALFGKKDYQQLLIVKRVVEDLDLGVEITGVDTVREPDGLALSSRNAYLTGPERKAASTIPLSLEAGRALFNEGVRVGPVIAGKVKEVMGRDELLEVEYVKVCDPGTLEDLDSIGAKGALLAVAVRVGRARLIDNILLF